jgi:hypothetical protein
MNTYEILDKYVDYKNNNYKKSYGESCAVFTLHNLKVVIFDILLDLKYQNSDLYKDAIEKFEIIEEVENG